MGWEGMGWVDLWIEGACTDRVYEIWRFVFVLWWLVFTIGSRIAVGDCFDVWILTKVRRLWFLCRMLFYFCITYFS